jgi:hypothetical protein
VAIYRVEKQASQVTTMKQQAGRIYTASHSEKNTLRSHGCENLKSNTFTVFSVCQERFCINFSLGERERERKRGSSLKAPLPEPSESNGRESRGTRSQE